MPNWNEFKKLFKVPLPVAEHARYYLETLEQSREHEGLLALADEYEAYEKRCVDGVKRDKLSSLDRLVQWIGQTPAYQRFQEAKLPEKGNKFDRRSVYAGRKWVSLDLVAANFHTILGFDEEGALPPEWAQLCVAQEIDPYLARSKSFRQVVFGNLNPKRNQRLQGGVTQKLWKDLESPQRELVFLEKDELIVTSESEPIDELYAAAREVAANAALPVRTLIRRLESFARDQYVVEAWKPGDSEPEWRGLQGVPGNRYMVEFKRRILETPLDRRDLLFILDGSVAMWVEESETGLPA